MIVVLSMIVVLWGVGAIMKTPRSARWTMIAILLVAVIVAQFLLPDGHPFREATGGNAALWIMLGAFAGLVWGYSWLLKKLRARSGQAIAKTPNQTKTFSDDELGRYTRHIVMREIGGPGQATLKNARVLVVGAGGLGAPVLQYLAASGVGTIGVIDDDVVDLTNLQRQVIHTEDELGEPKVYSAARAITALNQNVVVLPYKRRFEPEIASDLLSDYDLVLDGSDNFETRYAVNRSCVDAGIPLVAGALSQWEGQVSVYQPAENAPCYACVFPHPPAPGQVPSCAEAGVLGPLPGVIGSMMAAEAIKMITGAGSALLARMLIYDALYAETRIIKLHRNETCRVCGLSQHDA